MNREANKKQIYNKSQSIKFNTKANHNKKTAQMLVSKTTATNKESSKNQIVSKFARV